VTDLLQRASWVRPAGVSGARARAGRVGIELTPHTVIVSKDGKTAEKTANMDRKQSLEMKW
jgi:hypothetical protein